MKIWLITSENLAFHAGGIARYAANFGNALAAAGHEVVWISRGNDDRESTLADRFILSEFRSREDIAVQEFDGPADRHAGFPYNVMAFWSALSWQLQEHLLQVAERHGLPDVIESQDYMGIGYFLLQNRLLQRKRLAKVPVVLHLHAPDFLISQFNRTPVYRLPYYWYQETEKACLRMADGIVAPSAFIRKHAINQTVLDPDNVVHIPYPFPAEGALSLPDPSTHKALAYFGRLERRKGIEPLLESVDRLWRKGMQFTLTCHGGDMPWDSDTASANALFSERYKEHVAAGRLTFTGKIPPEAVSSAMKDFSICLIPSLWENFPHTCLEAMVNRRVVIASSNGGQAEMLGEDGECGFLHDPDNPLTLDQCIRRALESTPLERKKLGQRAHNRVAECYDPKIIMAKRLEHFDSIIGRKPGWAGFTFGGEAGHRAEPVGGKVSGTLVVIKESNDPDSLMAAMAELRKWKRRDLSYLLLASRKSFTRIQEEFHDLEIEWENADKLAVNKAAARRMARRFSETRQVLLMLYPCLIRKELFTTGSKCLKTHRNVHFVHSWILGFPGRLQVWPATNTHPVLHGLARQCGPVVLCRASAIQQIWERLIRALEGKGVPDFGSLALLEGLYGVAVPAALGEALCFPEALDFTAPVMEKDKGGEFMDPPALAKIAHLLDANGPTRFWSHPAIWAEPLGTHLAGLERDRMQLASRLREYDQLEQKRATQLREITGQLNQSDSQQNQLRDEITEAHRALAERVEESKSLSNELEKFVQEVISWKDWAGKLTNDLQWQKEQTDKYWAEARQLEAELARKAEQSGQRLEQLQATQQQLAQTEEQLARQTEATLRVQAQVEQLEAELARKAEENGQRLEQLRATQQKLAQTGERLARQTEATLRAQAEARQLQRDLEWQKEQTTLYWRQAGQLQADLNWQRDETGRTWQQLQETLILLANTRKQLASTSNELAQLKMAHANLHLEHLNLSEAWNSPQLLSRQLYRKILQSAHSCLRGLFRIRRHNSKKT